MSQQKNAQGVRRDRKLYWQLFAVFFKIGLFTFGGGYAMISMILSELSEKRKWIDAAEMTDVVAISESTPGPVAINSATYIGYKQGGVLGSLAATVGVVLPSLIIIYIISLCVDWFMAFTPVQSAFKGIQVAVAILILRAGAILVRQMEKKAVPIASCALAFALVLLINFTSVGLSTVWLILAGMAIGLVSLPLKARRMEGGKKDA